MFTELKRKTVSNDFPACDVTQLANRAKCFLELRYGDVLNTLT